VKVVFVVNAGRRFRPALPDGTKTENLYNKAERRRLRGEAMRASSRIDNALKRCREDDHEVAELAENSHQRRRAITADRIERNQPKEAKPITSEVLEHAAPGDEDNFRIGAEVVNKSSGDVDSASAGPPPGDSPALG
jgi:hypothetical protein